MKKKTQTILALGLIVVGALGLVGLRSLGTAGATLPAVSQAVAAPALTPVAATTAAATTPVDPALKDTVRDMLQKRMGLSAAEADRLAGSMAEHMQAVHGDQAGAMAGACGAQADGQSTTGAPGQPGAWNGSGMMSGAGTGSGMMGLGI
jgi:hypothetical protein